MTKPRTYELRRRAEAREETRRRIATAAVDLHEELGPARTTISAIAERAGVQRLTVYRHFPDERALFAACSTHWTERHPTPDPAAWEAIEEPAERLHAALEAFYGYYSHAEPMLAVLLRDEPEMAVVRDLMTGFHDLLAGVADDLARRFRRRGTSARRLRALVAHALDLTTFQSLVLRQGLEPREAARAMSALVGSSG